MKSAVREFSGRSFTGEEIELIKEIVGMYLALSVAELAKTVRENIGWLTNAGRAKTVSCMSFLKMLEKEGLIKLPGKKSPFKRKNSTVKARTDILPQFSASAWALKERDRWIGWAKEDKKERLHLIVNNSRFLYFPGLR